MRRCSEIHFVEVTDDIDNTNVDFFFQDNDSGAYCDMVRNGDGSIDYSYANVDPNWFGGSGPDSSNYVNQTWIHEIGHGLGLGHQGDYNGFASYPSDAQFTNDSYQQSIMSYFSQTENFTTGADHAYLLDPMAADWVALNDYSTAAKASALATLSTATPFGASIATSAPAVNAISRTTSPTSADTNAFCIVDGSGIDTVDFSDYSFNQTINLADVKPVLNHRIDLQRLRVGGQHDYRRWHDHRERHRGSGNDEITGNAPANNAQGQRRQRHHSRRCRQRRSDGRRGQRPNLRRRGQ